MNFLQNFIQKYEFYKWVYFKGGTESEDGKNFKDQKKIFRETKTKLTYL